MASTPELAALWSAYMQAQEAARQAGLMLNESRIAGGTALWTGQYSAAYYEALNAAEGAYLAWAEAVKQQEESTGQFAAYGGGE